MKTQKVIKLLIAILLVVILSMTVSQVALAAGYNQSSSLSDMFDKRDESGASEAASNIIGMIINIAQVIGTGVAIVMLIVLAIQYIAASPEGKAEIKKNATIYVVGAVILFAASGILGIVRRFAVKSVGEQGIDDGVS